MTESKFPQTGKLTFVGKYGAKQGTLILRPIPDGMGGYLGYPDATDDDLTKVFRKKFDSNYFVEITASTIFDLDNNKKHAADWKWIQECPEIGLNEKECKSSEIILYFLHQPELIHDQKMKIRRDKKKAFDVIENLSLEKRSEMVKYLGGYVGSMNVREIEEYLVDISERQPERIIKAVQDPNFKEELFVQTMLEVGQFKKSSVGNIMFGDVIVGMNVKTAIDWVKNPQNRQTVAYLFGQLKGVKAETLKSIIEDIEKEKTPAESEVL